MRFTCSRSGRQMLTGLELCQRGKSSKRRPVAPVAWASSATRAVDVADGDQLGGRMIGIDPGMPLPKKPSPITPILSLSGSPGCAIRGSPR